jgi:hypothetical protein
MLGLMWGQPPSAVRRTKTGGDLIGSPRNIGRSSFRRLLREENLYRNASATFPLAINSASRAKSLYITRSLSIVAHTARIAA